MNNDLLTILLTSSIAIAIAMIVSYIVYSAKLKLRDQEISHLKDTQQLLEKELDQEKQINIDAQAAARFLEKEHVLLEADYRSLRSQFDNLQQDEAGQLQRFESLANKVLEKQTESIENRQKNGMKNILDPLGEKIKFFEEKLEKATIENVKRGESLKEQIRFLSDKSEQVSKDANNLARALKGDFKAQGNWGEIILESILEKSGLVKGREYFIQETGIKEGKTYRPDVVLHLPDNKKIIIDSKVSLNAYNVFVNAVDDEEQMVALKAHSLAVRNHIASLTSKNYHNLYAMESPDFVLMFIPIDTALSTAIQGQSDIYTHAFDQNIILVTPSTLLATLKTVESLWRNENMNKNAVTIATEAGKMYDKFVAFVDDMHLIGKRLDTTKNAYNDALKKMSTGTGNLVSRADKLKTLGAKASKMLNN